MTNSEIGPSSEKPRHWVLHSTDASIANGQISWCALLEIPLAMALYGTLAYFSPWPWFSLLACLAVPVLLLRSEASLRRGKAMLWRYARRRAKFSAIEVLICIGGPILLSYFLSNAIGSYWLAPHSGWALVWRSVLLVVFAIFSAGAFAVAIAGAVAGGIGVVVVTELAGRAHRSRVGEVSSGADWDLDYWDWTEGEKAKRERERWGNRWNDFEVMLPLVFVLAGASAGGGFGVLKGAILGALAGAFVGTVVGVAVVFVLLAVGSVLFYVRMYSDLYIFEICLSILLPFVAFGLLIRITWIRIFATLRHVSNGFPQFSMNWRETVLVMDCWHTPELLPGAEQVNTSFGVRSLIERASYGPFGILFKCFLVLTIYLPAMLYRWNIKASTWLWGPLAFALRPTVWADEETIRERMSQQTSWPLLGLLSTVAPVLVVWLVGPWLPEDLTNVLPAWLIKWSQLLPAPEINLRTGLLVPTLVSWLCFLWFAYHLRTPHDKPLGDADNYKKYDDDLKDRFRRLARPVLASSQWTAALAILTVWAFALKWALNRWPQDLDHLVWDWLKPWL